MSDPGLLDRAVTNILRNAVRYVGSDLKMKIRSQVQDGEVEITFQDNGPGVPESDLPSLFDPFFRVETSRNRDDGGAGLGLALVRESVECCGGSVWAANATQEPDDTRGFIVGIRLKAGSS
jgi:signal transduction histidine kinase